MGDEIFNLQPRVGTACWRSGTVGTCRDLYMKLNGRTGESNHRLKS